VPFTKIKEASKICDYYYYFFFFFKLKGPNRTTGSSYPMEPPFFQGNHPVLASKQAKIVKKKNI